MFSRRCEIPQFDRNSKLVRSVSIILGSLSFIIPFFVFFRTMAPTLSFWDCGEFIACSYILGVPHPPGNPLFVLMGRFFILLGLFENIPMRINFISVISSALTTFLTYLVVIRASRWIPFLNSDSSSLSQVGIRIGAFSASLLLAFSSTFWFNAVETEVYGLSMFLMTLVIYLAIRWADQKEQDGSDRLLVFITYLLFLSIGVHLTVFLVVPALFLYFVAIDRQKLKDPLFWATWAIFFSIAVPFYFIISMISPWVSDNEYLIWMLLMLGGLVFAGAMALVKRPYGGRVGPINYNLAFALFAVAILGYSTHLYIPIRASHKPAINENDPSTWGRFVSFLERKQYGQQSMITRMFYRRGKLIHQFGKYENMGFGGYFVEQYASPAAFGLLRIVVFALGIFGLLTGGYYAMRKSKFHPTMLLFIIFFISSVILVLYLNFSDGTRPDPNNPDKRIQLEVRERDYFFTPAFVVFASIIGTGMAALMGLLGTHPKPPASLGRKLLRYSLFAIVALGLLLLPLNTALANYRTHDRSKDFVPADYAYNILKSCRPNAIIFTNGDNDTFPLWYLQEVEHVRKDVRVVNLSLLNTDWYILQLKNQMGVKMSLDDDQIRWIPAERRGSIIYYRPAKKFYDKLRRRWRYLAPEPDPRTGRVMRVQDQMIEQIVISNLDTTPIYFSGSVPVSNRWTLDKHLIREGVALRVDPDTSKPRYNIRVSDSLITKVYRYRGLNDLNSYKDENNVGLSTTFPERFSELAGAYLKSGDTTRAIEVLWKSFDVHPFYHQNYLDLQRIYTQRGDSVMADSVKNLGIRNLEAATKAWPDIVLYHQFLGVLYFNNKDFESARKHYLAAYKLQPNNAIAFRLLRQLYSLTGQTAQAVALMEDWSRRHPEDLEARNYLNRFR